MIPSRLGCAAVLGGIISSTSRTASWPSAPAISRTFYPACTVAGGSSPACRRRIGTNIDRAVLKDKRAHTHLVQPRGDIHAFIRYGCGCVLRCPVAVLRTRCFCRHAATERADKGSVLPVPRGRITYAHEPAHVNVGYRCHPLFGMSQRAHRRHTRELSVSDANGYSPSTSSTADLRWFDYAVGDPGYPC